MSTKSPYNSQTQPNESEAFATATNHSNMASQAIASGDYRQAHEFYKLALNEYLAGTPTVVEHVNAAATCFNLGALSKKLHSYKEAGDFFFQAEELYKSCAKMVLAASDVTPRDGDPSCDVCLFQLIVETLQARAHLHYKYQSWLDEAIECHEEVVELLEQHIKDDRDLHFFKVNFTKLSQEERWKLLVTSLQSLGKFYVEKGAFEDGLMAYQEALATLKEQQSTSGVSTEQRQEEISQIVKALSGIFMKSNGTSVTVSELQRFAELQEELGNWDNALTCWERVLYLQSQNHGEESIEVAGTLCHVGRVMLAQNNAEGALDLYKAAAAKFHVTQTPLTRELFGNITDLFCQLSLHDEALDWFEECLEQVQSQNDEALIWSQRGRILLEQGYLEEASRSLIISAEKIDGDDMFVFDLLQKVEFLQQKSEFADELDADPIEEHNRGLESIIEVDETSRLSQDFPASQQNGLTDIHNVSESPPGSFAVQRALQVLDEQRAEPASSSEEADACDLTAPRDATETDNVQHMSPSTPLSERRGTVVDDLVLSDEEEEDRRSEHSQPTADTDPRSPLHLQSNTDSEPPVSDQLTVGVRKEDSSRSTQETEQSMETSGDIAPDKSKEEGAKPPRPETSTPVGVESRKLTKPAFDATLALREGSDSESESGMYFRGGSTADFVVEENSAVDDDIFGGISQEGVKISVSQSPRPYDPPSEESAEVDDEPSDEQVVEEEAAAEEDDKEEDDDDEIDFDALENETLLDVDIQQQDSMQSQRAELTGFDGSRHRESPETVNSQSRTGLLHQEEKQLSHSKSIKMPSLTPKSPRSRDRREYADIDAAPSAKTTRNRIVKVLASPFRRTWSKDKRQTSQSDLEALDEEKEIKGPLPLPIQLSQKFELDEDDISESAADAPVSTIFAEDDDDQSQVSQITFKWEEPTKQTGNRESQWWWGVTAEGLEGWFPSAYVHQAVEAAEGFLSAKAIHEKVKSRPLDFDSDEESEVEGADENVEVEAKQSVGGSVPTAPSRAEVDRPDAISRNVTPSSSNHPSSSSDAAAATPRSIASKKTTVSSEIDNKLAALEQNRATFGAEHIAVATILFDLAVLKSKNGQDAEAMNDAQQALKIQKATLNMADACKTLHFMADVHTRATQYKAALSCFSEAQNLQVAVVGYFHEETANTLNRIGNVLARQGEFDMAMENHKEALRILKECCGEEVNHPLVSQTLIQIGAVYYKERNSLSTIQSKKDGYTTFIEGGMLEVIGRAHEERGSYRMAIAFFEEKLQFLTEADNGKDLEQVAETMNSLGMLSCRAGLYLEAIDYYDKALGIQVKLGCDDVQLAMARVLAGSVQYSLGHFDKALQLFDDALATLRDKIGQERETVAATLFHMGVVRVALCDFDNAMSDLQGALKTQKKLLGNEHPATLRTRREIGNLFAVYESELESAFFEYDAVLEAQTRVHGEKHPNIAETLHSIGKAQACRGEQSEALKTLEKCYNMRMEFLGMDHPLQATTLYEIAKIQLERGRVKKALHICDSALHIRKESLSENHVGVAKAIALRGSCLVVQSNFSEASKAFLEAKTIAEEAVGPTHPTVADIHVQMGVMHLRTCHFEEASTEITTALKIYRSSALDEDYPGIKKAKQELERIERAEMLCV